MLAIERCLMTKQRRTLTSEFKHEAACLVLDQGYSHTEAARSRIPVRQPCAIRHPSCLAAEGVDSSRYGSSHHDYSA